MAYLLYDRNYLLQPGEIEGVFFPKEGYTSSNYISCYVKKPKGGGIKGQISTGNDLNLPHPPGARPYDNSRTYQTYGPLGGLSLGFPAIVRIESIAIDVVQRDELATIYLNICDGALTELYRVTHITNKGSLFGTIRVPDYIERQLQDLGVKFKQAKITSINTLLPSTPKKKGRKSTEFGSNLVADPRSPQVNLPGNNQIEPRHGSTDDIPPQAIVPPNAEPKAPSIITNKETNTKWKNYC